MKTKVIKILSCLAVGILCLSSLSDIHAVDYSDGEYWSGVCSEDPNADGCDGYREYLQSQIDDANQQIENLENQRDEIAANISAYDETLKQLQAQEETKQSEISAKQSEIDAKQVEIDAKQVEIDAKQEDIDAIQVQIDSLKGKVKDRMVSSQETMRTSKYIDILLGAKSFADFIRITNGLNSITEYDNETFDQMADLVEQLNSEKAVIEAAQQELEDAQQQMEDAKSELVSQQNELILLQQNAQVIIDEYENQYSLLQEASAQLSENIASIQETLSKVDLDGVASNNGWTYPVPGAHRSAGTWAYDSGGLHLGYDFAASEGTTIVACASGLIINSADGCTQGYLGCTCAGSGGVAYGGNQVYLLCKVNGSLYAVSYAHMQVGSPIATGTVVSAGDYIGRIGATGNVTGPHTHVEVFYLGDASDFSTYAANWNGDMAFGCGWGYTGYANRCEAKGSAPCRVRPEELFAS